MSRVNAESSYFLAQLSDPATVREEHILRCCNEYPDEVNQCIDNIGFGGLRIREDKQKVFANIALTDTARVQEALGAKLVEKEKAPIVIIALKTCMDHGTGVISYRKAEALAKAYGRKSKTFVYDLLPETVEKRMEMLQELHENERSAASPGSAPTDERNNLSLQEQNISQYDGDEERSQDNADADAAGGGLVTAINPPTAPTLVDTAAGDGLDGLHGRMGSGSGNESGVLTDNNTMVGSGVGGSEEAVMTPKVANSNAIMEVKGGASKMTQSCSVPTLGHVKASETVPHPQVAALKEQLQQVQLKLTHANKENSQSQEELAAAKEKIEALEALVKTNQALAEEQQQNGDTQRQLRLLRSKAEKSCFNFPPEEYHCDNYHLHPGPCDDVLEKCDGAAAYAVRLAQDEGRNCPAAKRLSLAKNALVLEKQSHEQNKKKLAAIKSCLNSNSESESESSGESNSDQYFG